MMAVRRRHVIVFLLLLACAGLLTFIVSGHPDSAPQARPNPTISGVGHTDGVRERPTVAAKASEASGSPAWSGSTAAGPSIDPAATDTPPTRSGSVTSSPSPGSPPLAAPSLSIAPPSIPNGDPAASSETTTVGQSSAPARTTAATPSLPAPFQAHAVDAGVPAKFAFLPINATMQATAANCAMTGVGCYGLASATASTCTYPAYSASMTNMIAVGYSMWMYTPGVCRYAMGVIFSGRNG